MISKPNIIFNNNCKSAFATTKQLIEKRIMMFNQHPNQQDIDSINSNFNFLNEYNEVLNENNIKEFSCIENSKKKVVLSFHKKNEKIEIKNLLHTRTYLIFTGEIKIIIDNNNTHILRKFETLTISPKTSHTLCMLSDSHMIIIEE